MLKLIRKRGGRSYAYKEGQAVTPGWAIQDEKGNTYQSWEEYKEKTAPKKKVVKKAVKDKD